MPRHVLCVRDASKSARNATARIGEDPAHPDNSGMTPIDAQRLQNRVPFRVSLDVPARHNYAEPQRLAQIALLSAEKGAPVADGRVLGGGNDVPLLETRRVPVQPEPITSQLPSAMRSEHGSKDQERTLLSCALGG